MTSMKYDFKMITNTSSSSSCRATSTDIPDPLSPPLPIIHRFWQVFRSTSRIAAVCMFSSWEASSRTAGVLWGVAARTCSILLSTFLCNCRLASSSVSVQVVHPYSSIDTTAAWKKLRFILSVRSDFHMIDSCPCFR